MTDLQTPWFLEGNLAPVLDEIAAAGTAADPPVGVHLPRRVPFGVHGSWISDAELAGRP